jgi:hypothetical protein
VGTGHAARRCVVADEAHDLRGAGAAFTQRGPFDKFTVPGGGIVQLDTGVVRFDSEFNVLFAGGPHEALTVSPAPLCTPSGTRAYDCVPGPVLVLGP